MAEVKLFPIQGTTRDRKVATVCEAVYMRAYAVYSHVYGPQQALIEGGCRGGFSTGELVAFLYAGNFTNDEWAIRVREAFNGMNID